MKKNLPGICFLGCGEIAAKHTRIIKKLYPGIEISFASRNAARAQDYAKKLKGKHCYASYEEALSSNLFDIAFITTPHACHSKLAVLAANNKKDIIIEKPVTRNLKELSDIEKAIKKNSVQCAVAENYFYKPAIKKIRKYIDQGLIGEILFIELNKTNKENISGWRTNKELMGGGALLEGGVHWVNGLVSLAGSCPNGVIAFKPDVKYQTDVPFEDSLIINVNFDNGAVGKLLHSWRIINPLHGISLSKIYGTDGLITFESNGLFFTVHGKKKKLSIINPMDFLGFKAMHKTFINDYMNNNPLQPSLDTIKMELKIVEYAYRSLKTKKIETLK